MSLRTRTRLLCAALLGLVALLAAGTSAQARPFLTGMLDPDTFYTDSEVPFERTREAGATLLKANLYWPTVLAEPEAPVKPAGFDPTNPADPHYNFAMYDNLVRHANRNGLQVVFNLMSAPRWARIGTGCIETSAECAPRPADYADFAKAVATRYSGAFNPGDGRLPRVRYYQAWVEPNLIYFYKPIFERGRIVAADNYRRLLNAFYDAIHSVRNGNKVIAAGLAPLKRPGATVGPMDFMRRLLCMTGRQKPRPQRGCPHFAKFDIWATHPYTTGGPTHKAPGADDVALGDLHKMTTLLRAAERSRKIRKRSGPRRTPFWVTEFSYDSNPPDRGGLNQNIHTRWSTEAMYRMYKAGVDAMIWFGYRDQHPDGRPHCELFDSGIYFRSDNLETDRPKRFLSAFRFPLVALTYRRGFTYWGRTPDSKPGVVRLQLRNGGGWRTVKRVRARAGGVFEGRVAMRGLRRNASVRAIAPRRGGASVPFSLRYVRDFYQPPFGRCLGSQRGGSPR